MAYGEDIKLWSTMEPIQLENGWGYGGNPKAGGTKVKFNLM